MQENHNLTFKDLGGEIRLAERNITPGEVVKSSLWYTVGNFLQKGLGFLTLPIFARLMTKAELGSYSNFLVWIDIFVIVVGFSLESSINRARIDYPGEVDHYCSTILILGSGMAAIAYVIVLLCMPYFEKWLSKTTNTVQVQNKCSYNSRLCCNFYSCFLDTYSADAR